MLADPSGVQADLFRVNCLIDDLGNQAVRRASIVAIAIIAERKVAELQDSPPILD